MALPVGIQIGVELTNFIAPLTKTAFRLGSLAAREAIERSGSDELTELKLAEVLGRHRLDPVIATHFRRIVAMSSRAPISQFVRELVLESGAGPTVTQALASDNAALLSMVIQLSFLAWSHELQSLSQAMTQAIDDMLIESKAATIHGLNYVALLGTVGACQQQTAAFSWAHHYNAIEEKILAELKQADSKTKERPAKRRRTSGSASRMRTHHQAVTDRALPYVILRGMLRSLDSIQRFPEECLLQLSCDRGISSVILWCYHILGISVLVRMSETLIHFGKGPYNITVESCGAMEVSAVLLQRATDNMPVFTLTRSDMDPYIQADQRKEAQGFLRKVLALHGVESEDMIEYGAGLISECYRDIDLRLNDGPEICDQDTIKVEGAPFGQDSQPLSEPDDEEVETLSMNHALRSRIPRTVAFLLDADVGELTNEEVVLVSTNPTRNRKGSFWPTVIALTFAFARVNELTACNLLPLSLDAFNELVMVGDYSIRGHHDSDDETHGRIPDTIRCFELISRLLLGRLYTKDYVSRTCLISARGWSLFLNTMDAVDPADVASGTLHIKPGVPARDGIRKARVIDGMTDLGIDATRELIFNSDPRISFWPGVWTAQAVGTHVGFHHNDAFTVVQTYDWAHSGQACKKWRLGFREKQ